MIHTSAPDCLCLLLSDATLIQAERDYHIGLITVSRYLFSPLVRGRCENYHVIPSRVNNADAFSAFSFSSRQRRPIVISAKAGTPKGSPIGNPGIGGFVAAESLFLKSSPPHEDPLCPMNPSCATISAIAEQMRFICAGDIRRNLSMTTRPTQKSPAQS